MSVKNRLLISSAICLALVMGIGLTIILKLNSLEEQLQRFASNSEIVRHAFYLKTLAEEYADFHEERPAEQWKITYDKLQRLLEISAKGDGQDLETINDLTDSLMQLQSMFSDLVALHKDGSSMQGASLLHNEVEQKLKALFTVKLQSMIVDASRLQRTGIARLERSQKVANLAIIVFVLMIAGITIGNAVLTYIWVIKPIIKLTEGVDIVGSGELGHEVKVTGPGEVGRLAETLNKMTKDLKASYQELKTEIDHRKQAEKALAKQAEELARSNRELEQFAYVASHDLQEPLRNVTNCVQLLERQYKNNLDPKAGKWTAYAVESCTRMKDLIDDLLAFSRVGTQARPLESTDCEEILQKTLASLGSSIRECGAVITHDPLPTLKADASQLSRLFQNLVSNGIKFRGQEPPRIHLSVEKNEHEWRFSVRDNGIGIDPQHNDRIFVIFQRLHRKSDYPGTGIGLAIAKKIVERHGGRIWVESEMGCGATFKFTIPMGADLNGC